jgi:hypothetical protein
MITNLTTVQFQYAMRHFLVKEAKWLSPPVCGNCMVRDDGEDHEIETLDFRGDGVLIETYNSFHKDTVRDMTAKEHSKKFSKLTRPEISSKK